ncbi:hypothetical protein V7S43_010943 [Phytophthora oleae]|uniref:Calmodulin n=1 Tax=Phytophthora oleae TaxID=2107226 RepID=A0ABD3FDQ2_9STRA
MKPFSGGLKKGRRGLCTKDASAPAHKSSTAQFKLRALPLVTKKQASLETKPKATFLTSAGVGLSTEKQHKAKSSFFTTNSFIRPMPTDDAPKKSAGFSFMTFQPKSGKLTTEKTSFASKTPFLKKFSVSSLNKKSDNSSGESGSRTSKESSLKLQEKSTLPFGFRATSAAKKRKAESPANKDRKSGFPSKIGRADSSIAVRNPALSKGKGKQAVKNAILQGNASFTTKMGSVEVNDGVVLKKRSLMGTPTAASAPKRSKLSAQVAVEGHGSSNVADADASFSDKDLSSPLQPTIAREQIHTSPKGVSDAAKSVQSTRFSSTESPSPDRSEDWYDLTPTEIWCALMDDDKEDEFLIRATSVQEFTDRVGLEQKQFRSRLLDAHADVSESLLDALTVLLAEEGGIGIDKLDFDMDIDVDIGNACLQENDIQAIQ